jgi:hypothetical protein
MPLDDVDDEETTPEQLHAELTTNPLVYRQELRAKLKDEIFALWSRDKEDKYRIGQKLALLQDLHAKPGTGTFLQDVDELCIPHNTAYRRIKFYRHIEAKWEAGHDPDLYPVRSRPYRNGKDDNSFPVEELDVQEFVDERAAAADKKQAEIDAIIKAEAEKVERARAEDRNRIPRLNIALLLPITKRDKFKKKWAKMDEKARSIIVYEAVMDADTTST